jgi:hypothetical protein
MILVVKMVTMLEECITEKQRSAVRFFLCGQNDSMQRMFIKNVSCLRLEVFVA